MDQRIVHWIENKFQGLADELSERARRRWAAVEAVALGRGGVSVVSAPTGLAHTTIRRGIRELSSGETPPSGRQRRAGAGDAGASNRAVSQGTGIDGCRACAAIARAAGQDGV